MSIAEALPASPRVRAAVLAGAAAAWAAAYAVNGTQQQRVFLASLSPMKRVSDPADGWGPGRRPGAGRRGRGGAAARRRPAMTALAVFKEIMDASGPRPRIEAMLPPGCGTGS